MNLKDKLRFIESLPRQQQRGISFTNTDAAETDITKSIDGELRSTEHGTFFYTQRDFPLEHRHGCIRITDYLEHAPEFLPVVGKDCEIAATDPKKLIFIDTETTGLAGGSGTYAFMVGLGFFSDNSFRVVQYFMPDLNAERALLHEVNDLLSNFELIVSYNGKCYDIPLLLTRNIVHRMRPRFGNMPHLDLLFAVRRFWKHRLFDCSLETTERHIVAFSRTGDIPGYLIPYTYFRFLQERVPSPLAAIFTHNRFDILSMAGILSRTLTITANPLEECQDTAEILALGRIYEDLMQHHKSLELYQSCLATRSEGNGRGDFFLRMALVHKKLQQWPQAAELWHHYLEHEAYHPLPYIELAKHYEHRERNPEKAMALVNQALRELETSGKKAGWVNYEEDLLYRRKRLLRMTDTD